MTCTTHHRACDCREAAHAAEIERYDSVIERLADEGDRLRAEAATARREALEEAIAVCERVETVGLSEGAVYCAALLRALLAGEGSAPVRPPLT